MVAWTGDETQWLELDRWWVTLAQGRRRQLLTLLSTEPLPHAVAADLHRRAVPCPLVLVSDGARLVRRSFPSPLLLRFLAAQEV